MCNAGILRASPQAVIPHAFSVLCPNAAGRTGRTALPFAAGKTGRAVIPHAFSVLCPHAAGRAGGLCCRLPPGRREGGEDCAAVLWRGTKKGLLQKCFPVSAATVLINISLKTIHAGGFRCAPEERGITAYGLAHRLWIYPRFCALQERGSGLTVASLPHFMCRRHFRIPHSAFRLQRACFTLKK